MGLFSSITKLFQKDSSPTECCVDGVCVCSPAETTSSAPPPAEEIPVAVIADEINIALETAAEEDRLNAEEDEEDYLYIDVQSDKPAKKKKVTNKPSSKLPRKSSTKRKRS